MAKITRKWQISVSLMESDGGGSFYGDRTVGKTELAIPVENEDSIGKIIQAHVRAIATTADATAPARETSEPVLAEAAL